MFQRHSRLHQEIFISKVSNFSPHLWQPRQAGDLDSLGRPSCPQRRRFHQLDVAASVHKGIPREKLLLNFVS